MKKLLVAIAAVLVSVSTFAQGQVHFNNLVNADNIRAPIFRPDGVTGAGAGFTAELVMVAGANNTVVGTTTFRTTPDAATGFLNFIDVTIPGAAVGSSATFIIRAYDNASGSYATASTSGTFGQSNPVTVSLGGQPAGAPTIPAAALVGLQGFTMTLVPEPSTIALGVLGAAALLLRRRK